MEVFALGHEYAHFLVEEHGIEVLGDNNRPSTIGIEMFCDQVGLQISREWGSNNENWLAFAGIGALSFFRAVETCQRCAHELARTSDFNAPAHAIHDQNSLADSHPLTSDRIVNLIELAINKTAEEQREAVNLFLREYDVICSAILEEVSQIALAATQSPIDAN